MIDKFGMRNPLQYGATQRPSAVQFLKAADQSATGGALDPLRLMQLRKSVVEQQMRPQRTAAEQMMAMPTRMKQTPAVKPPSLGDRISGMMPAAGTPQAAGLGAAGAKMLQLSGYSDRPIAMSQILGEAAQAYTTAKKETATEQAATLAAKQELERQREKDALEAENIRSQIRTREAPKEQDARKPMSPAGKYAYDLGFDFGTPEFQAAVEEYNNKMGSVEQTSLTALQKEAAQIYPDSPEMQKEFILNARQRLAGVPKKDGIALDENNRRVGRTIFSPQTSTFQVIDDETGETRDLVSGERSVSDADRTTLLIPQKDHYKRRGELRKEKIAANKLVSYAENIAKTKQGAGRIVDQFMAKAKTFLSTGNNGKPLTQSELSTLLAEGKLQGLLGAFRIETVGGGVMTEQDALRVISYLGGDVDAFQNKEKVKEALQYILNDKLENYNDEIKIYNEQQTLRGKRRKQDFLEPLEIDLSPIFEAEGATPASEGGDVDLSVVPEGFPSEDWGFLSDADKREFLGL